MLTMLVSSIFSVTKEILSSFQYLLVFTYMKVNVTEILGSTAGTSQNFGLRTDKCWMVSIDLQVAFYSSERVMIFYGTFTKT